MQVQCPHCSAQFESQRSGLQFCPNCGQQIQVAASTGRDPSAASPSGAPTPGGMAGAPPPPAGEIPPMGPPPPGGMPPPGAPPPVGPPGWMPPSGMPTPGGPPPPGGPSIRQETPWERRKELGFFNGLLETWKQSILSPDKFWSSVKPDGRWEDAFFYGWLIATITVVGNLIVSLPFRAMIAAQMRQVMEMMGSRGNLPPQALYYLEMIMGAGAGFQVSYTILRIFVWPIGIFIFAALVHLFCILFGCATNGFWATFRALAYAQGAMILAMLSAIPCVGGALSLAAVIYTIVLQIWGVMRLQETSGGKAAAAVLATPVLCCCCCCGVIALAGSALKSMLNAGN